MQPPEGDVFHLTGEFLEVDPPDRLSYTFRWEEPTPDDRETVVTLTLREVDGSTNVVLDQGLFATEERLALHRQAGPTASSVSTRSSPAGARSESCPPPRPTCPAGSP
jgi:uncharacterized protein YndB with AHSA1/START domain